MIIFLAAAALHITPPEAFWCDDLHQETLQQCIQRTRRWICSPEDVGDENETVPYYAQTIREERRLVCHHNQRRNRRGHVA